MVRYVLRRNFVRGNPILRQLAWAVSRYGSWPIPLARFRLLRSLNAITVAFESKAQLPAKLVHHFNTICEHPAGSDLIFCPEDDADDSAEGITRTLKEWRATGLAGVQSRVTREEPKKSPALQPKAGLLIWLASLHIGYIAVWKICSISS